MTLPADQNNERDKRSDRQNPFPSTPISHSSPVSTTTPISLARSLIYNISSMIENESDESLAHRLQFQEHVVAASKYSECTVYGLIKFFSSHSYNFENYHYSQLSTSPFK